MPPPRTANAFGVAAVVSVVVVDVEPLLDVEELDGVVEASVDDAVVEGAVEAVVSAALVSSAPGGSLVVLVPVDLPVPLPQEARPTTVKASTAAIHKLDNTILFPRFALLILRSFH